MVGCLVEETAGHFKDSFVVASVWLRRRLGVVGDCCHECLFGREGCGVWLRLCCPGCLFGGDGDGVRLEAVAVVCLLISAKQVSVG